MNNIGHFIDIKVGEHGISLRCQDGYVYVTGDRWNRLWIFTYEGDALGICNDTGYANDFTCLLASVKEET